MVKRSNNGLGGQTDGGDEIQPGSVGMITRMNAQGEEAEMGRIEIDHMIRRRIEAMGQSMEGGGLMLPIGQQVPASRSKKHGKSRFMDNSSDNAMVPVSRYDGLDDDDIKDEDEKDEDAINSDLDDPEEKDMDDDEDDEGANTMLCMYDKVQRVKNKWFVSLSSLHAQSLILTFLQEVRHEGWRHHGQWKGIRLP